MSYEIKFSQSFTKKAKKFFKVNPQIYNRYEKTMWLLKDNPFHPSLRLHKLKRELSEYYSISMDMRYRIIMDFIIVENEIILLDIGSHDDVY
ncbi:MAG: type II toxin-antitoxin system YafQ family toxin [Epsilonproteobacteria bacterium]|nr:type II toxin-antitoxin system YafQ family toxin [Campylobacterota bacterium]